MRDSAVAPQAILAQLVLVGTLFLVTALRPYARPVDNWLSIVSLGGEPTVGGHAVVAEVASSMFEVSGRLHAQSTRVYCVAGFHDLHFL